MEDVKLIKPTKEIAQKLDYMICKKNNLDWKRGYLRSCLFFGEKPIEQGSLSDQEYYFLVKKPAFEYYLLKNGEVVGRANLSKRAEDFIDIQYVSIEEEYRGKGYGTKFIELLEKEIAKDSSVQGIFIEDASANAQTAAIARKLNYENIDNGRFRKYLLSDKKGKKLH